MTEVEIRMLIEKAKATYREWHASWLKIKNTTEGTAFRNMMFNLLTNIMREDDWIKKLIVAVEDLVNGQFIDAVTGDENSLLRELNHGRQLTILAWADLLEDKGDEAAAFGMRWLARFRKWPSEFGEGHVWHDKAMSTNRDVLPGIVVRQLKETCGVRFDTATDAMLAAAKVIGNCQEEDFFNRGV